MQQGLECSAQPQLGLNIPTSFDHNADLRKGVCLLSCSELLLSKRVLSKIAWDSHILGWQ
jgi:hypothetical protein